MTRSTSESVFVPFWRLSRGVRQVDIRIRLCPFGGLYVRIRLGFLAVVQVLPSFGRSMSKSVQLGAKWGSTFGSGMVCSPKSMVAFAGAPCAAAAGDIAGGRGQRGPFLFLR